MQNERSIEIDRSKDSLPHLHNRDNLDQQRADVDELLRASDEVLDAITNLQAQEYLEQNLQTGGQ
jgi:hypothetical protein